jgi:cell division septal protein FtsQ
MARKKKLDLEMEFSTDSGGPGASHSPVRAALRTAAIAVGTLSAIFGVAWLSMQTQDMLSRDTRFQIAGVDEGDSVSVTGVKRASRRAILKAFEQDAGKSIIDIDPEARRLKLRTVEWVRDATVRRVWPNHLHVDIVEREPVAFLPVASTMTGRFNNPVSYQPMLIDEDGAVLSIRGTVPQNLPLLIGVRREEDIERRRSGVRWMLRVIDELKEYRSQIIEVDVSNRDSLRVAFQMHDRVAVLILGNERFLERVRTFQSHYEGIRDRLSPRALLDVSLEGRITAMPVADAPIQ